MSFVLGLTGSIGMGKSTTAKLFAEAGVPVWDADATVHKLYAPAGAAALAIASLFPAAVEDGAVSRAKLRALIAADPTVLDRLQALIHPLVSKDRADFIAKTKVPILLLDLPLLYETGADGICDAVVVVTAPADIQRARVLERGQMSEADFEIILSRQMPDAEKRARADYVIETLSLDSARAAVAEVLADVRGRLTDA